MPLPEGDGEMGAPPPRHGLVHPEAIVGCSTASKKHLDRRTPRDLFPLGLPVDGPLEKKVCRCVRRRLRRRLQLGEVACDAIRALNDIYGGAHPAGVDRASASQREAVRSILSTASDFPDLEPVSTTGDPEV